MYMGFATATEAAAFGVVGSLVLAAFQGSLNWQSFSQSLMGATRTSAMIALILAGAAFLSLVHGIYRTAPCACRMDCGACSFHGLNC